jgi:CelD/BcsL family acetyltransferase involved in cellulose biosynthesis
VGVERIDPIEDAAWEEFVRRTPGASVFHGSAWARVLAGSYGFRPHYLAWRDAAGEIGGGLALFEVNSRIAGRRLVGLPFSDVCPPLAMSPEATGELLAAARQAAAAAGRTLEVRGELAPELRNSGLRRSDAFVQHVVPLAAPIAETWARLHKAAKKGVRKGEREGVGVRLSRERADLERFYRLNIETRRKHGVIPQPWRFFERVQREFMDRGDGFVLLAEYEGKVIGADVVLCLGETMVSKFNASLEEHLWLRPNDLLLWRTMELAKEGGYRWLDMGRCETGNEGLRHFKLRWGSEETALPYYFFGPSAGTTADDHRLGRRLMAMFARHAPPRVLGPVSALVYRHLA